MPTTFDVIVIGLGAMGSAAATEVARRGQRVLGLEQYRPAHDKGSSHGESRIIRLAYFEDPAYVPLLRRAYQLWQAIERETGTDLMTLSGGLMIGRPDSEVVSGAIRSAREHGLDYDVLDAVEIHRRFPPLQPASDIVGVYERDGGFLRPEASIVAYLKRAAELGADLHFDEPVTMWDASPSGSGVRVTTARGGYEAERLVIAAGPWAPQILADLHLPMVVQRQVLYWFAPVGGIEPFMPERFPIYIWGEGSFNFYGFPALDGAEEGVKVAFHKAPVPLATCTPESVDRTVHAEETARMRECIADRIPTLNGEFLRAKTCLYTTTADGNFVIGLHPDFGQVAIAGGFSGHGFKFMSVVGEILADLATEGKTDLPIGLFSPERFAQAGAKFKE